MRSVISGGTHYLRAQLAFGVPCGLFLKSLIKGGGVLIITHRFAVRQRLVTVTVVLKRGEPKMRSNRDKYYAPT